MTPDEEKNIDWSLGTFEGARRANQLAFASMTDEQKVEWLGCVYELVHPYLPSRGHYDPDDWSIRW